MGIVKLRIALYDLMDIIWFNGTDNDPRNIVKDNIPNVECRILDMCCGCGPNAIRIASANPKNHITAIDHSSEIIEEANRRKKNAGVSNVDFVCADALNTGFEDSSFDYIILSLVLHESSEEDRNAILSEAIRLLKNNGKLIILEWEPQENIFKRILFLPVYIDEIAENRSFESFFRSDKKQYFAEHGLTVTDTTFCHYTSVMIIKKR